MEFQRQTNWLTGEDDLVLGHRDILVTLSYHFSRPLFIQDEETWLYAIDGETWIEATGGEMGLDDDDLEIKGRRADDFLVRGVAPEFVPSSIGTALMDRKAVRVLEVTGTYVMICLFGLLGPDGPVVHLEFDGKNFEKLED